jgi:hypothetical protein
VSWPKIRRRIAFKRSWAFPSGSFSRKWTIPRRHGRRFCEISWLARQRHLNTGNDSRPWLKDPATALGLPKCGQEMAHTSFFLTTNAITAQGRVGRPVYCWEREGEQSLDLADEVMKTLAYWLVTAGYRLVMVDGAEFVLEVPDGQTNVVDQVTELATSVANQFLDGVENGCCDCRLADRWPDKE